MKIIFLRVPGKNRKNPKCWYLYASFHRTDGPAVISSGKKHWFVKGVYVKSVNNDYQKA